MDLKQKYEEVIKIIDREEDKAEKDFSNYVEDFYNTKNLSSTDVLKECIKWKSDFLKNSNSKYFILKEYLNKYGFKLKYGMGAEAYHEFFVFLNGIYLTDNLNDEKMLNDLAKDIYACKKSELNYFSLNKLIEHINSNTETQIKLPPIENFEIDILKDLIDANNTWKSLNSKYDTVLEKNTSRYEKMLEEIQLERHNDYKVINELKGKVESLSTDKKHLELHNKLLLEGINRVDHIPVKQFDILYWGDNYPALKVLFDFLQKMNMVDFNWSYFADLMCIGNNTPFNISSVIISKSDIGYLLFRLKPFYSHEYSNSNAKYRSFLQSKIFIDNSRIDEAYIKKYLRGYSKGKNTLKKQSIIDDLCQNISRKYN